MPTEAETLKARTRIFALDVIRLVRLFPRSLEAQIVGRQLIRAGTAVAANYRAACRSQSPAHFVSKISVVAEEADESQLWLDLTIAAPILDGDASRRLFRESAELSRIFTASRSTAKANQSRKRARSQ